MTVLFILLGDFQMLFHPQEKHMPIGINKHFDMAMNNSV